MLGLNAGGMGESEGIGSRRMKYTSRDPDLLTGTFGESKMIGLCLYAGRRSPVAGCSLSPSSMQAPPHRSQRRAVHAVHAVHLL